MGKIFLSDVETEKSLDGHHSVITTGYHTYILECGHVHLFTAADHKKWWEWEQMLLKLPFKF